MVSRETNTFQIVFFKFPVWIGLSFEIWNDLFVCRLLKEAEEDWIFKDAKTILFSYEQNVFFWKGDVIFWWSIGFLFILRREWMNEWMMYQIEIIFTQVKNKNVGNPFITCLFSHYFFMLFAKLRHLDLPDVWIRTLF